MTRWSSSQDKNIVQPKQKCLLAQTEMSSSQNRNVFQPKHISSSRTLWKKNTKIQNATFQRIMTNVPGIVPQPYPIVNYPGTFVIIIRKIAFFLVGSPDRKSTDFFGKIFRRTFFGETFSANIFQRKNLWRNFGRVVIREHQQKQMFFYNATFRRILTNVPG